MIRSAAPLLALALALFAVPFAAHAASDVAMSKDTMSKHAMKKQDSMTKHDSMMKKDSMSKASMEKK